jgi:hypothetical protein
LFALSFRWFLTSNDNPRSLGNVYSYDHVEAMEGLMSKRTIMTTVVMALLAAGRTFGARAQQPTIPGEQTAGSPAWIFNIAPYLWMPSIHSTLNFNLPPELGGTVTANSSIGFGDLVSHLYFATMVAAHAQYGPFSVVTDFMYMNLGGTAAQFRSLNFPNHPAIPLTSTVQTSESLNQTASIWTLAGGYTLVQGDWGNFDAIAGVRFLALNTRVNYSLGFTVGATGCKRA